MLGQIMVWSDQHHPGCPGCTQPWLRRITTENNQPMTMDIPKIGHSTNPQNASNSQIVFVVGCSSTIIYPILVALRVLPILKRHHHLLVSAPLWKIWNHSRYQENELEDLEVWNHQPVPELVEAKLTGTRGHGWAIILPDIWDVSTHVDCQNSHMFTCFSGSFLSHIVKTVKNLPQFNNWKLPKRTFFIIFRPQSSSRQMSSVFRLDDGVVGLVSSGFQIRQFVQDLGGG